jgi:two-component system LytT family sensor kinase
MFRVRPAAVATLTAKTLFWWFVFGAFLASRDFFLLRLGHYPTPWPEVLIPRFFYVILWAALTPILLGVSQLFAIRAPHRVRNAVLLVVATLTFGVLRGLVGQLVLMVVDPPAKVEWRDVMIARSHNELLTSLMVFGLFVGRDLYRETRQRERQELQLEARLARAELQFLKAQLQPHFLFNTLNTVAALIESDPRGAEKMLSDLGDLLRRSLDSNEGEVPLSREVEFLERYIGIQKVRFGDRLRARIDVDPGVEGVEVPSMILQPLVENAITHSIAPRREGGSVEVRAFREGNRVRLQVIDDGQGIVDDHPRPDRIGLGNTRARLERMFGRDHALRFLKQPGRFIVEVDIPAREAFSDPRPAIGETGGQSAAGPLTRSTLIADH